MNKIWINKAIIINEIKIVWVVWLKSYGLSKMTNLERASPMYVYLCENRDSVDVFDSFMYV